MRYVVRFQGKGARPLSDVEQIRGQPGVTVLEESSKMLLIESDDETLRPLVEGLSGWVVAPEQTYPVPDTRKRLRDGG